MNAKAVLVTGASSGFGKLTSHALAKAGHEVFAGFRNTKSDAANEAVQNGIQVVELDVTKDISISGAVAQILERTGGRLDVVVNNAGIASAGLSESFSPEQMRDLFDVNVFGVQRVLRATLPTLKKQKSGLVINVGSILGRVTFPFFGLYGASKYAVEAMTESYRYELSQLGIDVVLIQPSAYPTQMYASAQQANDTQLAESYGDVAQVPGQMLETFMAMFQGANAPKPTDVAQAIEKIIATPAGARPDRVVVGTPFGADAVNHAVAPIQNGVLQALGLSHLTQLKK